MWKALFYKEWIKTRRIVALIAAILTGFTVYAFIDSAQGFRVHGAVQVWNAVLTKDAPLLPAVMQWIPALTALMLALAQFLPEMTDKRLKLTLHLPMPENRIIASLLAYGLAVLAALYALACIALAAGLSVRYPAEMIGGMCARSLPWMMAGIAVYLLTAWVCVEPLWKNKILNALAAIVLCSFFFIGAPSGAYAPFIPYLAVFVVLCFTFPFHSAARFKQGAQR